MNARVFVLALVTGVFMAAWNADERARIVTVSGSQHARSPQSNSAAEATQRFAKVESEREDALQFTNGESAATAVEADAAELDATLVATSHNQVDARTSEIASCRIASKPGMRFGTGSPTESIPMLTSLDEIIVSGTPVEASESITSGESAAVAEVNPAILQINQFLSSLDRLLTGWVPETPEPDAESLPEDNERASAATADPDDVPMPKDSDPSIIPVPYDLPAGKWHVIRQSGETFLITIERISCGPESTDRFCVRTAPDGDRWCFVRTTTEPAPPIATKKPPERVSTDFWSAEHGRNESGP